MAAEWFCYIAGREFGPLSAQELRTMVAEGSLTPRHHVRRGRDGPWIEAGQVKGLFPPTPQQSAPPAVGQSGSSPNIAAAVPKAVPARPTASSSNSAIPVVNVPTAVPFGQPVPGVASGVHVPLAGAAPTIAAAPRTGTPGSATLVGGVPNPTSNATPHPPVSPEKLLLQKRKRTNRLLFTGGLAVLGVVALVGVAVLFWPRGERKPTAAADAADRLRGAEEADLLRKNEADSGKAALQAADSAERNTGGSGASPALATSDHTDTTETPNETWTPADTAVRRGSFEIRVDQVGPGKPVLVPESGAGGRRTFRNPMLIIKLSLRNIAGEGGAIYRPWSYRYEGVSLRDDRGRVIVPAPVRARGLLAEGQQAVPQVEVDQDQVVEDLLVFEIPRETIRSLRLLLPGAAVGATESIGFEIAATMFKEFDSPRRPGTRSDDGPLDSEIIPGRANGRSIERTIDELDPRRAGSGPASQPPSAAPVEAPVKHPVKEEDPAGDVSKINRDIEELEKERGDRDAADGPRSE